MAEQTDFKELFSLEGKTAVITGGAGVIGNRVAKGMAAQGANVALIDLDVDKATADAAALEEDFGVRALGVACDVADQASIDSMIETVSRDLGPITVLHNNAATKSDDLEAFFAPVEDYSLETWREIMTVNLDGMFLMAKTVGKHMIGHGQGGSIIQTSSTYGVVGPDPRIYEGSEYLGVTINTPPPYAASKAAVVGLTRYLATVWATKGIRVNTLVPGGVESGQNETFQNLYGSRTPLGRMADRDEMVGAVVYLASDASSYMTGQMMVVDGGWTAW